LKHKFRIHSIHGELELLAKEFGEALAPQKNDKAEYLLLYMENYPNAELGRVLGTVKGNFLDENNTNPVRRKCAKMLGEIGKRHISVKTTPQILELLLNGMKDNDPHMACECMASVQRMAEVRRWQDFDHVILPLLERVVDSSSPNESPNVMVAALDALFAIRPNEPEFLDYLDDAKKEVARKKRNPNRADGWDNKLRQLEKIRQEWKTLLIQRGKWEEKKAGIPAPKANPQGNNNGNGGKRRRIVTP